MATQKNANSMTIKESLNRLIEGNERFVSGNSLHQLQDKKRIGELANGQKPFAIILSCSDSRVVPELAFDTGLGKLFVIRVAGNIANTSSIASIEYAVALLGTPLIVVLAHQSCGAVTAAIAGGDNGKNLNHLLSHISAAIQASADKSVDAVAIENAKITAKDLVNKSPIISKAITENKVAIRSAFYQLADGKVVFLD
jgi:carbonic anhydrase